MLPITTTISPDGRVASRTLPPDEAAVTLTELLSHREAARAALPEGYKGAFDDKMDAARVLLKRFRALEVESNDDTPVNPPEPTEALLAIAPRDELLNAVQLDRLIERLLRTMDNLTMGYAEGLADDPRTAAALLLRGRLFDVGRRYLKRRFPRQWYAIDTRLKDLKPEHTQALEQLGLTLRYEQVVALNDFFGQLIGVTRDDFNPDTEAEVEPQDTIDAAMDDFTTLMTGLIGLANATAPATSDADAQVRTALLDPYLKPVLEDVKERSDARRDDDTTDDDGGVEA
ncbi:MAG: hypothetical protein CMH57_14850 [Myxococcales bacterium]|nr:hypothetical protein [Myxococcales bacterium]